MNIYRVLVALLILVMVGTANSAPRRWTVLETWTETSGTKILNEKVSYDTRPVSTKVVEEVQEDGSKVIETYNILHTFKTTTWTEQTVSVTYERAQKRKRIRVFRQRPKRTEAEKSSVESYFARDELVSTEVVAAPTTEEETTTTAEDTTTDTTDDTTVAEEETTTTEDTTTVAEDTTTTEATTPIVEEETTPVVAEDTTPSTTTTASLDFGINEQYLGTPTEMPSNEASYYSNLNNFNANSNGLINQDDALARGWTGKGSTIAILDSGIDTDHAEFAGKIKYQWEPGYDNGIEDRVGHGSHVASIAAGNLEGDMIGVAPDADLAVVKITDSWSSSMSFARKGIEYMKQFDDVVVANLSSNVNYNSDYRNSITNHGDGIFTSNHQYYGGTNYYNLENPAQWGSALSDSEIVLTVSAGNQSNDYVQNPATFATATDAEGNLLLDGRMIIVGNWNASTNTVEGGKAGHVCKNYGGGQCNDAYKTSDFYILAPGMSIEGVDINGGTKVMSGTSQAAPVVAGAVAVVHQMWPYMPGKDITQLLLKTADKDLTGYDVDTHGQGLLDLDAATRPQGELGISFTGRTGTTVPITGGLSIAGGDASSTLSSIKTVDELGRDYTVNLSSMTQTRDLIPVYQLDHSAGTAWSSKFVGGAQEYRGIHFNAYQSNWGDPMTTESFDNITLGFDSTMFSARHPVTGAVLNPSNFTEKFTMTRSQWSPFVAFNGMFGEVRGTTSFEYSSMYKPNNWYGQIGVMYSLTEFKAGMVDRVDPITSMYAVAGWDNGSWNFYGGIKPTIVNGNVSLTTPSSVSADGTMHYTRHNIGLRNDPVGFVGAQFKAVDVKDKFGNNHSLKFNGVVDQNNQHRIGAYWTMEF